MRTFSAHFGGTRCEVKYSGTKPADGDRSSQHTAGKSAGSFALRCLSKAVWIEAMV